MSERWMIRGVEFSNCNCAGGCPCQFNSPSTHGFCEAIVCGIVEEGHFGGTRLDGLHWVMLAQWPGEIAEGNGRQRVIVDERADERQREALRRILHGQDTEAGATHFYVFNSTMSEVLPTLYAPIEASIDVEARKAHVRVPGLLEVHGEPLVNPHSGEEFRAVIELPNGFEYTRAEIAKGRTRADAGIRLDLDGSHGHFNALHMTQSGVVR
jgi:hypothetical protein